MKRLLSIFVAMLMVTTMLVPSIGVFAEETETAFDPFAGDHVAGELTDNLFQNPSSVNIVDYTTKIDSKGNVTYPHTRYLTMNSDFTANPNNPAWSRGFAGLLFQGATPAVGFASGFKVEGQETMVFRFSVRNHGTTDSFVWNAALCNTSWSYAGVYPIECGSTGFTVSDKTNWVDLQGTCKMPGVVGTQYTPTFSIGFQSAAAGSSAEINYGSKAATPYIAFEKEHDIVLLNKGEDVVIVGSTNEFEAKIVNQVGSTGYLTQPTFTFTTLGADGNAVEGLTVTNTGSVATVSATDEVADGTYYLRATAAIGEETTWQKTIAFKVAGAIENTEDYVVGEIPANLITSPKNSSLWYTNPTYVNSTTVQTKNEWTSDGFAGYAYKTTGTVTSVTDGYKVAAGSRLFPEQFNDYTATEGEHYVIKFAVRSLTENTGFGVRIGTWNGAYSGTAKDVSQIMDYENGVANVPGDGEWHTIKGTLPALRAADINDSGKIRCIIVGMAAGTPADVTMELNNHYKAIPDDVPYFAKEAAYDINVTGAANAVSAGGTMNLEAEVLNQIETKGALTQSFDWVAVNTARTSYVEGITFDPSNDGANVTVNVADTVPAGNYIIVAQNKTYGMNRQYPITVTGLNLDTTESSASLTFLGVNATEDVMVVIAAYNGNRIVKASKTVITPVDGVATLSEADVQKLTLSELTSGNKVRVFVWTADDYTPLTMNADYKKPVTIE